MNNNSWQINAEASAWDTDQRRL